MCGFNSLKFVFGILQGQIQCCCNGHFASVMINTKIPWRWQVWGAETWCRTDN